MTVMLSDFDLTIDDLADIAKNGRKVDCSPEANDRVRKARRIADQACGVDNPLIADIVKQGTPDKLPPRPFLGIGVRARTAWNLCANRDEA